MLLTVLKQLYCSFSAGYACTFTFFDSHLNSSCKGFKYSFYFMVLIYALRLDVKIAFSIVAERFKKVHEHFSRHVTNIFSLEINFPHQPGSASKIYRNLCQAIVHWQHKTIPLNSFLFSKCLKESVT